MLGYGCALRVVRCLLLLVDRWWLFVVYCKCLSLGIGLCVALFLRDCLLFVVLGCVLCVVRRCWLSVFLCRLLYCVMIHVAQCLRFVAC